MLDEEKPMRLSGYARSLAIYAGLAVFAAPSYSQQADHSLPQAIPGAPYAAQLAIPPGLGYPFAHCELLGEVPRWLAIDCERLQLKGKVPTASIPGRSAAVKRRGDNGSAESAIDRIYRITIQIADAGGNARDFAASLRVSSAPELVSLADSPPIPIPVAPAPKPANLPRRSRQAAPSSAAQVADRAAEESAPNEQTAEASADPETDSAAEEPAGDSTGPETEAPEDADATAAAANLSAAVATMRKTSAVGSSRSPATLRPSASSLLPRGLHAYLGTPTSCLTAPPTAAGAPEDADAIAALKRVLKYCNKTKANRDCKDALNGSPDPAPDGPGGLLIETEKSLTGLNACAALGNYSAATDAHEPLDAETSDWYKGRAALWRKLQDDMTSKSNADNVKKGRYLPPLALAATLQNETEDSSEEAGEDASSDSSFRTPLILGPLNAGATSVNVLATTGTTLRLYSIVPPLPASSFGFTSGSAVDRPCSASDIANGTLVQLKTSATDSAVIVDVPVPVGKGKTPAKTKIQTLYPKEVLAVGTAFCVQAHADAIPAAKGKAAVAEKRTLSRTATVVDSLDWGRVRAYFVGGVLISNTNNSFSSSSANQFLDLNVDKFWIVPDCASVLDAGGHCAQRFKRLPGISTYFDTRLTAIPIAVKSKTTAGTTSSSDNSLTTQKTARVQAAAYFPYILANWNYNRSGNALYVAPIAKVGFDTLTGTTNPTVTTGGAAGTSTTQANLERVYNFYSFGGRVGHFGLYPTKSKSPELQSYFDVSFGPYSNLASYVCHERPKGSMDGSVSSCATATFTPPGTTTAFPLLYASEKRIWRLDLEGVLKVPSTPLVIGFNANIGQKSIGANDLDTLRIPADDVRFLFGTKFDIATAMKKLGVGK